MHVQPNTINTLSYVTTQYAFNTPFRHLLPQLANTVNIKNVGSAIAIMTRVKARSDKFSMVDWQNVEEPSSVVCRNEKELHACGTGACFAGWVAVSPEWAAYGGKVHPDTGAPVLGTFMPEGAIARWLGIHHIEAEQLCGLDDYPLVYGPNKPAHEVTVDDVLEVLYRLRDTGSCLLPEYVQ